MATLALTTAVGSPFDIRQFSVRESLSNAFEIELTAVAEDPNIDLEAVVGRPASFHLEHGYVHASVGQRTWSGIVAHVEQIQGLAHKEGSKPQSTYSVRIVPKLWLLKQRKNHRIFQHINIPDIVDKLLGEWSIKPTWKIDRGTYPKLEYKVQYGETDWSFLNRLLEEAGITFYFGAGESGGELVLSDQVNEPPKRQGPAIVYEDSPTESAEREFVTKLRVSHEVRPGAHQTVDYDFRNPSFRLFAEAPKAGAPESFYEQYEYIPGSFLVEGQKGGNTPTADDKGTARYEANYGKPRTERALFADRASRRVVTFETNVVDISPGTGFSIENHPHDSVGQPLLTRGMELSGKVGDKWDIVVHAIFKQDPYRPPVKTPKPKVYGVQSATVVGPQGQEIYTDEFGRVRVQFPWDREGQFDDNSSTWIRVSQGWSGTGFGMVIIPRIRQEVLVGFLDGDPEQPIIVGRSFNAVNPAPYKLPENKTVSGWKTNSSPSNGGYNEMKLEDKANKELIYLQAQRDFHALTKRDATERVERHHHHTVLENQHLIVKKIKKELIEVDDHLHVKGDRLQKIDKSTSLDVGTDQQEKVGNKHALEAGKEIHLKAGTNVVIEAGSRLTLKGPGGFVDIHSGGIDIVGTMVKINSGGSAGSGSGSSPKAPADAEEALPKDTSVD